MKTQLIRDIKSWLTISATFIVSVLIFWTIYAAISQVNEWDPLTATKWNEIVDSSNWHTTSITSLNSTVGWLSTTVSWLSAAPTWMIAAFNLSSCPDWWNAADWTDSPIDLRWQFLRWINNFWSSVWTRADGKQDPDWLRAIWSYQADGFKSHTHTVWDSNTYTRATWTAASQHPDDYGKVKTTSATWWNESRSKNVWVIYCVKN